MVSEQKTMPEHKVVIGGNGTINGITFEASGTGCGDAVTGRWDFNVTFSNVPDNVDPFANLLGILILPTAIFGKEHGEARNLLTLAQGNLEFTQLLRGDDVSVQTAGTFRKTGADEFLWGSTADGTIHLPELGSVEPFDAVMLPQGYGKITEVFAFPFMCKSERILVQAIRNFTFTPRAELREMQFRRILIRSFVQGNTVTVNTTSIIRSVSGVFRVT